MLAVAVVVVMVVVMVVVVMVMVIVKGGSFTNSMWVAPGKEGLLELLHHGVGSAWHTRGAYVCRWCL